MTAEVRALARGSARAPLVPAGVDLRSATEMPIDLDDLRDSDWIQELDLAERGAAVLLHMESMRGKPTGSLPDNDVVLARYLGFGRHDVDRFVQMRPKVLHGWIACSDGRPYHPERARAVLHVWIRRQLASRNSALGNEVRGSRLRRTPRDVEADIAAAAEALREIAPRDSLLRSIAAKMTRWKAGVAGATGAGS